jgi:16S rRNA (guanine527-N7)-methyltransferase
MPASPPYAEDGEEAAAIEAAAFAYGVRLPAGAAGRLAVHGRLVREAARTTNLTTILEPAAMRVRHVLDSLLPLAIWPEAVATPGGAVDMGSGAGYPGLPLVLAGAAAEAVLVDATRRKVEFLDSVCATVGAPARAMWGRAEDLAGRMPARERVWARAVGPLPVLVELAFGMLARAGVVVCWKGPEARGAEGAAGEAACRALGGEPLGMRTYSLPEGAGERTLFAYRRGEGALPRGVPRAPAVIRRRPLGP